MERTTFTYKEVLNASLKYFKGDDLAATTWINKYCLKEDGKYVELTPDDMHCRLAEEFHKIEAKYYEKEYQFCVHPEGPMANKLLSDYGMKRGWLQEDDIYDLFKDFKYIIPQGSVMSQLGASNYGSLSNCFVIGQPEDSYGGIFQKEQEMVQLMKNRGGVGIDLSTLRPAGALTTNAAQSSTGACSFMHRFSHGTREVAQNGRRGALMISMDVKHPDILEFVKIKRDLTQVTGANISIKLNDEFMKAVEADKEYTLRYPCNVAIDVTKADEVFHYNKTHDKPLHLMVIKAKDLWDEIIKSAHSVAEPGLMFWDNMVNYSPDGIYPQFKQVTTNPCSEIAMQKYDACRLIAVNLFSFVDNPFTKKAKFNFNKFYGINYEAMRLSDNLIDLEVEKIDKLIAKIMSDPEDKEIKETELKLWEKIRKVALSSRRTGLGFTALGDTLAALGLAYDSVEAKKVVDQIMSCKLGSELDCTTDLAIIRGKFIGSNSWQEVSPMTHDILSPDAEIEGANPFYEFLRNEFPEKFMRMMKHGRRNVSWSTVAPTGTVSLLAQTTSGIEPLFQPYYTRRRKLEATAEQADFIDQNGDKWEEFFVIHPKFKDWLYSQHESLSIPNLDITSSELVNPVEWSKEILEEAFKHSPWYKSTASDIDWERRVELQALIQKYISHSISSTINLHENVTEDIVSKIYMESWKKGLKGITVYRDGSRSGVLVTKKGFESKDATKRPKVLAAEAHVVSVAGESIQVYVGLLDGIPYEVFAYPNGNGGTRGEGEITKIKRNEYVFTKGNNTPDKVLTEIMSDEQAAITRLISLSLRHGADIKFTVEQLNKSNGNIFSYTKAISRVLKKYIPEGARSTVACQESGCGSSNVIFEEGCHKCLDCGSSKCG